MTTPTQFQIPTSQTGLRTATVRFRAADLATSYATGVSPATLLGLSEGDAIFEWWQNEVITPWVGFSGISMASDAAAPVQTHHPENGLVPANFGIYVMKGAAELRFWVEPDAYTAGEGLYSFIIVPKGVTPPV